MSNKVIHSQGREIIYKVYEFMKREKEAKDFIVNPNKLFERLSEATGVSIRSLKRIATEGNEQQGTKTFTSPRKTIAKSAYKSSVDDFDEEIIRKVIYNFTTIQKRRPSMETVFAAVQQEGVNLSGKLTSFRRIVKKIGFYWQKTKDNRKVLMEKPDIRAKRTRFLRQIIKYREEGRTIVYNDESYLHSSHSNPYGWYDRSDNCLKTPIGKGQRLIMVHCGGEKGFVPNALLMFKSGSKSGDYHDDMNHKNYMKWIEEKLLRNLEKNSVLVIDNASYHNVEVDRAPTSVTKKGDMQKWLNERGIFFEEKETKPELYDKIKLHKPLHKTYALDRLMAQHGHSVLRLPPYHPELNPIEKIWAQVKNHVGTHNVTFKFADVWKIAEEKFDVIGEGEWKAVCDHVKKVEKDYLEKEPLIDEVEELIIRINSGESDEEFSSEEEDEDEDMGCYSLS